MVAIAPILTWYSLTMQRNLCSDPLADCRDPACERCSFIPGASVSITYIFLLSSSSLYALSSHGSPPINYQLLNDSFDKPNIWSFHVNHTLLFIKQPPKLFRQDIPLEIEMRRGL